jgi:hypothetical protein
VWTQREGGSARPQTPLYAAPGGRCICQVDIFEGLGPGYPERYPGPRLCLLLDLDHVRGVAFGRGRA